MYELAMWTPGPFELIIILVIVLLLFGAGKLPDVCRSLGKGIVEFKEGIQGKSKDENTKDDDADKTA